MKAKRILTGVLVLFVMTAGSVLFGVGEKEEKSEKTSQVIVGTFASRAVKLAYDTAAMAGMMPALDVPKPMAFRQGFGKGDVSEYLDLIREEIPKIAKEAGVDLIVSKWDIEYHDPNVKLVDITEALIQPFKPTEERMKIIRDLKKNPPATEKEIRELEKSGREL